MTIKQIDENTIEKTEEIKKFYKKEDLICEKSMYQQDLENAQKRILEIDNLLKEFKLIEK